MASIDFPGYGKARTPSALEVLAFDGQRWSAAGRNPEAVPKAHLRFATFNTWFQGPERETRNIGLLDVLREADADIIVLQETTVPLAERLLDTPWVREGYQFARAPFRVDSIPSHGLAVLSRLPLLDAALFPLTTHMGRGLLLAHARVNDHALAIATVHLESLKTNADVRARQLGEVFARLETQREVILAGDFNFCASWASEEANLDPRYRDLWRELHRQEPGFTQDTDINVMLARAKGEERKVRFDRVMLRDEAAAWRPEGIELLGTRQIPHTHGVFPSDHFGLLATLHPT